MGMLRFTAFGTDHRRIMTPQQIDLVQDSFDRLTPVSADVARSFYQRLFEIDPTARPMFKADLEIQGGRLLEMIGVAVRLLHHPGRLVPALQALGARHLHYGVTAPHYSSVGVALLQTLGQYLGDRFTEEVRMAWEAMYTIAAREMLAGAASNPVPVSTAQP